MMELFPHGKINLSLFITGRRPDGYHTVDTIYWPLALFDYLRVDPAASFQFSSSEAHMTASENLVEKAWKLMQRSYGIGPVRVHLEKGIPWEAGLGGGSADAATMLYALNRIFRLGLTRKKLAQLGSQLGADVPVGLLDGPARGTGTGAQLEELPSAIQLHWLILKAPVGCSTARMYQRWDEMGEMHQEGQAIQERQAALALALLGDSPSALAPLLHNDFEALLQGEEAAMRQQAGELFEASGALGSLLCGSGAAVAGLYESEEAKQAAKERLKACLPEGWRLLVPFADLGKKQ